MNLESFKELSKWVMVNNKLLQSLLILQIGETKASKVFREIILETEKEFKAIEKEQEEK